MFLRLFSLLLALTASIVVDNAQIRGSSNYYQYDSEAAAAKACLPVKGDSSSLLCNMVPKCDENSYRLFQQFNRIIFNMETSKYQLNLKSFQNCSFSWSSQIKFEFVNLKTIRPYAFQNVKVGRDTHLTIKLDGVTTTNIQQKKQQQLLNDMLVIRPNAFRDIQLEQTSQLVIEILNYKNVLIHDVLIDTVWQKENSAIHLNVHDIERLIIQNSEINENMTMNDNNHDYDTSTNSETVSDLSDDYETSNSLNPKSTSENFSSLKNNKSYSLELTHIKYLQINSQVFCNLQVNPFSGVAIIIQYVEVVYLADSAFESLLLGVFSQFNLIVDHVTSIALGKDLFKNLYQDKNSAFFFQMDQINHKVALSSSKSRLKNRDVMASSSVQEEDDYNDDYDSEESSSEQQQQRNDAEEIDYNTEEEYGGRIPCFCLPEGFLRNVQLSDSSVTQVHLTHIDASISISSYSFDEIQLNKNSKFRLLLQNVRGAIILDTKAINMIKLSDGMFELWVENHLQINRDSNKKSFISESKVIAATNRQNNQSSGGAISLNKQQTANNSYFKLMKQSINQVIFTPKSTFKIGFINSDSILLTESSSLTGFRVETFSTVQYDEDYRTKLTIEIRDSDNVRLDFMSQLFNSNSNSENNSKLPPPFIDAQLPKLIEIDGYQPILSVVKSDGSIDTTNTIENSLIENHSTATNKSYDYSLKRRLLKTDNNLVKEFCRYYRARPFVSPPSSSIISRDNVLYFSEAIRLSAKLYKYSPKLTCTSCLFLYLYRTVHRRQDFNIFKEHLPQCFINLHYKADAYYLSNKNAKERQQSVENIEENMRRYWKLMRCESITGLEAILDYDPTQSVNDQNDDDNYRIHEFCKRNLRHDEEMFDVASIEADDLHDSSLKICSRNLLYIREHPSYKLMTTKNNNKKNPDITLNKSIVNRVKSLPTSKSNTFTIVGIIVMIVLVSCVIMLARLRKTRRTIKLNFPRLMKPSFQRINSPQPPHAGLVSGKPIVAIRIGSSGTNTAKYVVNNHNNNGDYDEGGELNEDDLNGFEYDDEFELAENAAATAAANADMNDDENDENHRMKKPADVHADEFVTVEHHNRKNRILDNTLVKIRKLKKNLFNSKMNFTQLKNHLSASGRPATSSAYYSYNSTDSTVVQKKSNNEFEMIADNVATERGGGKHLVTYDPNKKKSKPVLVNSDFQVTLSKEYGYDQKISSSSQRNSKDLEYDDGDDCLYFNSRKFEESIRVASNPLHDLNNLNQPDN